MAVWSCVCSFSALPLLLLASTQVFSPSIYYTIKVILCLEPFPSCLCSHLLLSMSFFLFTGVCRYTVRLPLKCHHCFCHSVNKLLSFLHSRRGSGHVFSPCCRGLWVMLARKPDEYEQLKSHFQTIKIHFCC